MLSHNVNCPDFKLTVRITLYFSIASTVLSLLLVVLVVAVMKWKKKDEEEMRLKEEEYMNSRRVSQANINRTKGKSRRGSTVPENFKKTNRSNSAQVEYNKPRRHSTIAVAAASRRKSVDMVQNRYQGRSSMRPLLVSLRKVRKDSIQVGQS